ncbi:uncharacterized protein EI90DRAFT_2250153 [Cantharellus anzutake]|uniref:uncharacterized protein n=1 Tax=Cantharellus anzutake TaxID=1750568 RepID=UPI0019086515|nr:uncharacterized protein EI90DRAFT_2250153 [Cantharellus anzutake]KAF8339539.1 hypothetical protein EI90DRAFT_2250153 [Cantharellus anzutake]
MACITPKVSSIPFPSYTTVLPAFSHLYIDGGTATILPKISSSPMLVLGRACLRRLAFHVIVASFRSRAPRRMMRASCTKMTVLHPCTRILPKITGAMDASTHPPYLLQQVRHLLFLLLPQLLPFGPMRRIPKVDPVHPLRPITLRHHHADRGLRHTASFRV